MIVNVAFLITEGKNLILQNSDSFPPNIKVLTSVKEASDSFLNTRFGFTDEWTQSARLVSYLDIEGELFLFKGLIVPENFALSSDLDWTSISSLHNIIEDDKLYYLIMSFLNSI